MVLFPGNPGNWKMYENVESWFHCCWYLIIMNILGIWCCTSIFLRISIALLWLRGPRVAEVVEELNFDVTWRSNGHRMSDTCQS